MTTPIQNLHIDPAHYTLSWDPAPGADITTGAFCRKGRDIFVWVRGKPWLVGGVGCQSSRVWGLGG